MKTMIQAHRGASSYCPENTLEAFSLAIEQKADCLELDVHFTKDSHIVVAHDARLERVSDGIGYINDHTLEELRTINFGKLFPGDKFYRIPLLSDVLELVKPHNLFLNIEIKTIERLYPGLTGKLVSMIREYSMEERIIYSSFNHYSLMEIKKLEPGSKIALLYELGMVDPWVYANYVGAWAIHPHYYVIAALPETVERCHENGLKVNVWTVDDREAIKLMLKSGVDGIITNMPDIAVAVRDDPLEGGNQDA